MVSWRVKKVIDLDLPADRVFNYLSHWESVAEWDPSVVSASSVTAGEPAVGSSYRIVLRFGGQRIGMSYKITAMAPHRHIELTGRGAHFQVVDRMDVETIASGSRLTYRVVVTFDRTQTRLGSLIGAYIFGTYAETAIQRLRKMLSGSPMPPRLHLTTRMADKAILPGLAEFTRLGSIRARHRRPVASALYKDRLIVLTGGTSGIGNAAAWELYRKGAHLVVVGRDAGKLDRLRHELELLPKGGTIETELADLSLMAEVRQLSSRMRKRYPGIDVLINNAGALFKRYGQTIEGVEKTMATDLVGPYLLTRLLLPALKTANSARIVNVSSGGMYTQSMQPEMLQADSLDYDGATAYARAKRGLVNLTAHWARELAPWGISVHAMHPGWVDTPGLEKSLPTFYGKVSRWLRTAEQGADTIVWLAASPDAARASGHFWLDRKIRETAVFRHTQATDRECSDLAAALDAITGLTDFAQGPQ